MSKLNPNQTIICLPDDTPGRCPTYPTVLRSSPLPRRSWLAARTRQACTWC